MKIRPLKNNVVISYLNTSGVIKKGKIIIQKYNRNKLVLAKILKKGPLVSSKIHVGDIAVVPMYSGQRIGHFWDNEYFLVLLNAVDILAIKEDC